jgi:hypothetical protein
MASGANVPESKAGVVQGQEVSLGCGTLILIALIVMFFTNRSQKAGNEPVLERLDAIERQLDAIEARLEQAAPPREMGARQ